MSMEGEVGGAERTVCRKRGRGKEDDDRAEDKEARLSWVHSPDLSTRWTVTPAPHGIDK